jgi:phosphatidate cytidylyltransferase
MQGLLRRGTTAVLFVIVMLGGIYGGHYPFVILFTLITALCLWEFLSITLQKNQKRDLIRKFIGLIFGLTPFVMIAVLKLNLLSSPEDFVLFSSMLFFPIIFLCFVYELFAASKHPFSNVAYIILGMVYIGTPFALVNFIAFDGELFRANTVFGLLLLTWINDTAAYLVGSKIGKTKLFPRISPKKTWEGSIGGGFFTLLLAGFLGYIFTAQSIIEWLILGGIVVIFGSIGDLIESMFKRSFEIKDSGTLLPGHGGLLDRFDAFIFLVPFATAYILWIRF